MEKLHSVLLLDYQKSPGHMALLRLFHRYMKKLLAIAPHLKASEAQSQKPLSSLSNLLEQQKLVYSIKDSSNNTNVPLFNTFPDAQSRLMVKLSKEIEDKVQILTELCSALQDLHTTASKGLAEATSILQRYKADLDIDKLNQGEATVPPVNVMLSWLVGVEAAAREQHCSRRYFLENIIDDGHPVSGDNLAQLWMLDFDKLIAILDDCREQSSFFLDQSV